MNILLVVFYLVFPAYILFLCKKFSFLDKFGAVGIAYITGMVIGNMHFIAIGLKDLFHFTGNQGISHFFYSLNIDILTFNKNAKSVQDFFSMISIALALPLILLTINLKQWSRLAGRTALSMLLGIIAIVLSILIGFYFFGDKITESWKVAGLLTGVYLGATFNMAAIQMAIGASKEMFGIVNAIDILVSVFYFFFLITVAQRLLNKVLPKFDKSSIDKGLKHELEDSAEGWDGYKGIFSAKIVFPLLLALLISVVIAAISFLISNLLVYLFPASKIFSVGYIILCITSLSILTSVIPRINKIKKTFQTGMYLILIFCLVVGSMADLTMFANTSVYILWYVIWVIFGSLLLHFLFAWIFKIDTDTVIITSSAMIFSPPFVPAIANALHNREIILSGITVGIVGYSIGNYIGIALAFLLK